VFKKGVKKFSCFAATVQGQAEIGGRLLNLLIPRIIVKNRKVFLQRSLRFASLQVLFRFFESLGDVRHGVNFLSRLGQGYARAI
jgi:hypothetical protein